MSGGGEGIGKGDAVTFVLMGGVPTPFIQKNKNGKAIKTTKTKTCSSVFSKPVFSKHAFGARSGTRSGTRSCAKPGTRLGAPVVIRHRCVRMAWVWSFQETNPRCKIDAAILC